jgi:hypothetical protein
VNRTSRRAWAATASVSSTARSGACRVTEPVTADIAATRRRSRGGSTRSSFRSAPSAASLAGAAIRNPTTAAIASSSVSTSGGIARPATRR